MNNHKKNYSLWQKGIICSLISIKHSTLKQDLKHYPNMDKIVIVLNIVGQVCFSKNLINWHQQTVHSFYNLYFFFTENIVVDVNIQIEVLMLAEWRGLKIVIHVIIFR